jgi:hypothetical protein
MGEPNHVLVMLMIEFFESALYAIHDQWNDDCGKYFDALHAVGEGRESNFDICDAAWNASSAELSMHDAILAELRAILKS